MSGRRTFRQAFRATSWDHWREAMLLTFYTHLGGLAPLWIGWLVLLANRGKPSWLDFAQNGEFALYAASLLAPVCYVVVHERSEVQFTNRAVVVLLALAGLLISVACYGLVAPETTQLFSPHSLDRDFVGRVTIWLFFAAVVLSLLVTALDNARGTPAVEVIVAKQRQDLEQDLDRLRGRDANS